MDAMKDKLGFEVRLQGDFEEVEERVRQALMDEGFGVLTEIDVQATLKKKLDKDFRPYKILGACNPPIAYQALTAVPQVGLLLPCNVTLSQADDGAIDVMIINPDIMLNIGDLPQLRPAADQARERLERVVAVLKE